ncbi:MAG: HNH endonuclease [Chloroflexia bacterium]|nr:HNH endonuclease [Chloroflexia bacterium]
MAKYILVKIENQIANKDYQPEEAVATIEHILPENPGGIWNDNFPVDVQEDYIYRLGNYALLEASINNKLENNLPFADKLVEYKKSSYKLSNEYCDYEKFDPKVIALRQSKMAKVAKGIWRSTFIQSLI